MRKILFLTSRIPYPPIGGDRLRAYWFLNILAKHFKIHLVSISEGNINVEEFENFAKDMGITYKLFPKKKLNLYLNALKTSLNKLPLQVNYYYFKELKEYIDSVYADFDLLFSSLIRTANYLINKDKPKILDMTDSISQNYSRSKEKTKSLFWKIIYSIEASRLYDYEKRCIEAFDKTLLISKNEADYYNHSNKISIIPNGVDKKIVEYNKLNMNYKNCVVFFGKMDYQPNVDAVLWFVNYVLPHIKKDIKFVIVGINPTNAIKKLEKSYRNVVVTGYIQDPYEILQSSLCVVAPMQTGGGIQNKILESMAVGAINIVSSLAAKPIGAVDNLHFLIRDDPLEIAQTINDIHTNPYKYKHIRNYAREFIKENFTWDKVEKKLLEVVDEVLHRKASN